MPALAEEQDVGQGAPAPARSRARAAGPAPFSLVRWFAAVSAIVVAAIALASGLFVERFLTSQLLGRDGFVMMRFLNGVVRVEDAAGFFESSGRDPGGGDITEFFQHLGTMPGVLRANAYGQDRTIVWSTEPGLVGQRFLDNPELEQAFRGSRPIASGMVGETDKREHALLGERIFFVENYLPIWADESQTRVVGVVEFYRTPTELLAAIQRGRRAIWIGAAIAAAVIYGALFGFVLRADRAIRRQTAALGESQTMAALGEMASAVAHSLRNPLAAIRSSAELALDEPDDAERRELMTDVLTHVDGMSVSIGQYLSYGGVGAQAGARAELGAAVDRTVAALDRQLRRARIRVRREGGPGPAVAILPLMLDQVLHSVFSNAIEAMPCGGEIRVAIADAGDGHAELRLSDTGPGMTADQLARAFAPFATTKRNGLGMGLPLARQILARQGGDIRLLSAPGAGTEARLRLRRA
jgi:signal transduction histidine kinase